MTRVAHVDPVGGLAGDMLLAALLDAGAPRPALDDAVASLGLSSVALDVSQPVRGGLRSTHVAVRTEAGHGRTATEMRAIVAGSRLAAGVRARALDALDRLIAAEAAVHGVDPSEVVLRLGVKSHDEAKVDRFGMELVPLVTSGPPGVTGFAGGRPKATDIIGFWPALVSKEKIQHKVTVVTS